MQHNSLKMKNKLKTNAKQLWVEKYRPGNMNEIAYQEEIVAVLRTSIAKFDLPNLLFYGPPGTGKTSTILSAAKELFGDMYRERVLELNASDERGINVIREKVKNFAQQSASGMISSGKRCPPFKIVVLDEADSMTVAAQAALRRTMELESKTTRFCLICNYVTRIIEPITSRCAKFRFKLVNEEALVAKLKYICDKESISCEQEALKALIDISDGDMRQAINTLQSTAHLCNVEEGIKRNDIIELSGMVGDDTINNLLQMCITSSQDKLELTVKDILAEGFSAHQLLLQLHDVIVTMSELKDSHKAHICEHLSIVDKRLADGGDGFLQILDVCQTIRLQVNAAAS